jgi:bifunctional DNA-binding transcriptional regulator/antitoxin component of YhaV-PrlF toxin-antitoxin module
MLSIQRRSTRMDWRGRIHIHRDIRKIMGLLGGGKIEWFIDKEGRAVFRKAKPKKKFR